MQNLLYPILLPSGLPGHLVQIESLGEYKVPPIVRIGHVRFCSSNQSHSNSWYHIECIQRCWQRWSMSLWGHVLFIIAEKLWWSAEVLSGLKIFDGKSIFKRESKRAWETASCSNLTWNVGKVIVQVLFEVSFKHIETLSIILPRAN